MEITSNDGPHKLELTSETLAKVDEVVTHYPQKRSAVLPLLHLVQEEKGFISRAAVEWIAERLELEPINVWELVSFYPMFREKPIGRRHIKVCRTLSCALVGSYKTCEAFQEALGCGVNEVSDDGEATIEFVECLASCGTGPVVMVDDELYEKVDTAKAKEIVAKIKNGGGETNR